MAKVTIEVDDNLQDDVESVIEEVKEEFMRYLADNKPSSCPDMSDLDYSGAIHEIVDGTVPVYTRELEAAWFLHGNDLKSALDSAGLYSDKDLAKLDNDQMIMSAYYCYLNDAVAEWFNDEAETIYDEWVESGQNDYSVGDEVIFTHPETEETFIGKITAFADGIVVIDNGEESKEVNACDLAMYEAPEDE